MIVKKKGFTLIEMMIALAIFSLFVGFLYNAYFSQIKENNSFNNKLDLKYNGDKAINLIINELRSNVNRSEPENTIKFIYAYEAGSTININKITSSSDMGLINLIDLTGAAGSHLSLIHEELKDINAVVQCTGITSINIQKGNPSENEEDLLIITINLQLKNDQYTVTSAVNINK